MMYNLNLRTKLLISICSVILGAFIITNLIIVINMSKNTTKEALDKTSELSSRYSYEIRIFVEEALIAARTLAESFEGMKYSQSVDRNDMNNMLKQVLERNPKYTGVWTCWEPNALDGRDMKNMNTPGHDSTGRFVPYWCRDVSGKVTLVPLTDYTVAGPGDYYLLARNSGEETIIDPYLYDVAGKKVLMTSLVVPIKYNGRVVGVAGIDLAMDTLQLMVNQIKPFKTGYAVLIANNLTYVTNPNLTQLGKKVENDQEIQGYKKVIAGNSNKVEIIEGFSNTLNNKVYRAFVAVNFGRTKTPWVFMTDSPVRQVLASVRQVISISIILSIITLILLVLVILAVTNRIVNPLKRIMTSLREGAIQVSVTSRQISSTAHQISEGSTEQASAIEEVSSTLQESATMLQQNTDNTKQAAQLSEQTKVASDNGSLEMQEMLTSVQEIKKSSDQISKIIKVIDDIAFQTNILALNAAVEAARAGEAGMGFAVVAEEVRNLASRSAQAAKDTTLIIESNIQQSSQGVAVVERVRMALAEITDKAKKVNELMAEIAVASQEQAQGVDQVNRAMMQMGTVTQQYAGNAEESASAAEKLNTQALNMNQIVNELSKLVNGSKQSIDEAQLSLTQNTTQILDNKTSHRQLISDKTEIKPGLLPKKVG